MTQNKPNAPADYVLAKNATGSSSVVLVCEHASHFIPVEFDNLGLSSNALKSHVTWDPGAMAVATQMARNLGAALVSGQVSRLVYDCNRPPTSLDAMPARSELIDVPGNQQLSLSDREIRVNTIYRPFQSALSHMVQRVSAPILVTIHSFTPSYFGKRRSVEIGILHDSDARLASAMLQIAGKHTTAQVRRNQPYGPEHGVTHTLKEHAVQYGHLNVMIEIRNDLIETPDQQVAMAATLSGWVAEACDQLNAAKDVQCQV